ncbi:MAG: oxidoreductase [Muricauda sp.]|jgi:predicted dehydrogenase|nr:Gfo/Idh/MocA family oxidoreductase [Allomuricauda sp.]MAU26094.1 oxidoreductase [Allomuricauda sp.]MBC29797.1 oxidoreductase [Allomuricauda sp.]|tara:strand:- start:464 stop:1435 length:972 start_codon:yes stop_codon:yes gene_type:complete
MSQKIHWGIVGLGKIAASFVNDLKLVEYAELTAVASRSQQKAKAFAKEHGARFAFGDYTSLFEHDRVDVVYIATPHTFHAELAIQAMQHKKHVLCEKPMGISVEEVERMVKTASDQQVFLMEALWSRFNPTIRKVKQLVESGEIGRVRYLHADFAFYGLDKDPKGRLLNPSLAGGSLLDIGIYPIFLAYLLFGKPQEIIARAKFHSTGVEVQTAMLFEYEDKQAILYSGLGNTSQMRAEISGEGGTIFIEPRWHEAQAYSLSKNGEETCFDLPATGKGYTHEIEEVNNCIASGKLQSDLWSQQNSMELMQLIEAVKRQADIAF